MINYRAILFHKQATSARLRFLKFNSGTVCALGEIPKLAQVDVVDSTAPALHPTAVIHEVAEQLGLEPDELQAEPGYHYELEVPGERIRIVALAIQTTDPPFDIATANDASFIDLTQAIGLPVVELELLRGIYELVLGG